MEAGLLELSRCIASKDDLVNLAMKGLDIRYRIVQKHLNDNPSSINTAAEKCFFEWLKNQDIKNKICEFNFYINCRVYLIFYKNLHFNVNESNHF